jgi:hypothetical protein
MPDIGTLNGHASRFPGLDNPEPPARRKPGRPKGSGTTPAPAPASTTAPLPRGVRRQPSGRYSASVKVGRKEIGLGTYPTIEEAADAARIARERAGLDVARPPVDKLAAFLAGHHGPAGRPASQGSPAAPSPSSSLSSVLAEAEALTAVVRLLESLDPAAQRRVVAAVGSAVG